MTSLLGVRLLTVHSVTTAPLGSDSCCRVPKPASVGVAATAVVAVAIVRAASDRVTDAADAMMVVLIVSARLVTCLIAAAAVRFAFLSNLFAQDRVLCCRCPHRHWGAAFRPSHCLADADGREPH